ncbi:MAG: TonB-dependent receptor plug domain-containing protein [Adhaeribacter sp.]
MRLAKRLLYVLPLLLCGLFWAFTGPQDEILEKIMERLRAYQRAHPQEKIFLHLDKAHYAAGEDIWFKAYSFDARLHTPDSLSKNIYVELLSPEGKILLRQMLLAKGGFAPGDFDTPDTLAAGRYQVRAYTHFMRNFPEDYFFRQDIHIWNTPREAVAGAAAKAPRPKKAAPAPRQTSPGIQVQFFPEGGYLVAGLNSIVGLKAWNQEGKGEDLSGVVLDEKGQEVSSFQTSHLGMGSFIFQPLPGKAYTARVKTAQGQTFFATFPPIQAQGLTMRVNNLFKDKIQVIVGQQAGAATAGRELLLLGHIRGLVCASARGKATGENLVFTIPKKDLPSGVIHFTLFDGATREPLNERLIYHRGADLLQLDIKTNKPRYKARELVQLDISATTPDGKPAAGHFSLAVTDGAIPAEANGTNLVNYLLLSSDLQGHIEQPEFYFKDSQPATVQALDNLMLTQGWRRFVWKQVLQPDYSPLSYYPEQHISISGQINRLLTNKPLANADVLLYTVGRQRMLIQAKTNETGRFRVDGLVFDSLTSLFVQARNEKGRSNTAVVLDKNDSPPVSWAPRLEPGPAPMTETYLQRMRNQQKLVDAYVYKKGERVLKEVQVTARREQEQEADLTRVHGTPDKVIKVTDQMASYADITQVLQGRVAGLVVSGGEISIRGGGTPMFLLDGMQIDADFVMSISPMDIESIEVLKGNSAAIYGSRGGNGVIALYSKKGTDANRGPAAAGTATAKLMGYYKTREFFSPKYNVAREEHNLPDLRTTVYWNPAVKTDSTGKARVSFYNADQVQGLRLSLQGISPGGLPGSRSLLIGGTP